MHVSTEANFVSKISHSIVYEDINLKKESSLKFKRMKPSQI